MNKLFTAINRLLEENLPAADRAVVVIGDLPDRASQFTRRFSSGVTYQFLSYRQADQVVSKCTDRAAGDQRLWPVVLVLQHADFAQCDSPEDRAMLVTLLCRLRDVYASTVMHIVETSEGSAVSWSLADSLAMGFSVCCKVDSANVSTTAYQFSISDYKLSPEWLNSRHWAHPHLWKSGSM